MKRIALFLFLFSCFFVSSFAQSSTIKAANDLYVKGDFTEAAKQYEKILSTEGVAAELYYNLGNSYFKSNELGKSILNYERALRLSPGFDDARFNLEMAQMKVVDNIVPTPTFFLGRWITNFIKLLSSNGWIIMSVITFIVCLIAAFLFVLGSTRYIRKIGFYLGTIFLSVSLLTLFFAGIRDEQMKNHSNAIIMSGVVTVKSSPDKSGTDLFQLHEGTKVSVKSSLGKWIEIKLGNGSIGWVEKDDIVKI